ncbi:radical SAM family heme chaperone HemW [Thalassococcus sp. CAU 1522]|uniref:Heme chaperone HemW n=1 Tax=Thalassococcus arenae TaxID=2851652 RepID=A0ABS6N5Y8_9RHOB|nr:radical SAM family heme chaperone HemW [Thalassococcus arenae]MBV2359416.1 radical SAM family heme chaperone HemW [Thalassococcus arenae]
MPLQSWWRAVLRDDWREGGFGLYVHWPFCEAKCPYCDFNSHVQNVPDQKPWADALVGELRRYAEQVPDRVLNSIFFGGGTPSLMSAETVDAVLSASRTVWRWANDIEITLEANPRSVEIARFSDYADAGVNRISLGVQSLVPRDLKRLGRLHDVEAAKEAYSVARKAFDRVSFDLIYARQDQTLDEWETELGEALSLAVDHLSLYQLTIEPGTAFWARAKAGGLPGLPDEDLSADFYDMTVDMCRAHGFSAYEVSNFARPGAESRHNLIYWRNGDYVGIGPGAHGRITVGEHRFATVAARMPNDWLARAATGRTEVERSLLSMKERSTEYIMMGLRLSEGVNVDRARRMHPEALTDEKLVFFEDQGLIERSGQCVRATQRGRLLLNRLVAELAPD